MTALNISLPKTNSAADQRTTVELNQRDDGPDVTDGAKSAVCGVMDPLFIASDIADDAKSADWGVTDLPPLPKPREPKEIVDDLKKLAATDRGKCLKLAREQMYAPQVMLSLASDFAICFGGPRVVRKPMSLGQEIEGKFDSRDIHPTLSSITKLKDGKYSGRLSSLHSVGKHSGRPSSLPSIVFDIGRLYLRISDGDAKDASTYEATDYRAVMDVISRAVWLFYEYYEVDEHESPVQVPFQENQLTRTIGIKRFDSAIALQSIEKWDDQLPVEVVKTNIRKSRFMFHACIAPALSCHVEDLLEPSRKQQNVQNPIPLVDSSMENFPIYGLKRKRKSLLWNRILQKTVLSNHPISSQNSKLTYK